MFQHPKRESSDKTLTTTGSCDSADSADSGEPPSAGSQDDSEGELSSVGDGGRCHIELICKVKEPDPPVSGWLEFYLAKILQKLNLTRGDISLLIVDDAMMGQMHKRYKDVEGTTDVLSFDMRDSEDDPLEADLVICADEASRQAAERGHTTREELLLYAVHGLLHMLGYDDHGADEAAQMHRMEDRLLSSVGLGPIFGGRG